MVESITQKPWGWSTRIYCDESLQAEKIYVRAGGFSSIHMHEHKVNQFLITSGVFHVSIFDDDNRIVESAPIEVNTPVCIDVLERHQFHARTACHGFEFYWTQDDTPVLPDDIVRFSANGVDERYTGRPIELQYVWCCECNRQCNLRDTAIVCVDNAYRDMCLECIHTSNTTPIDTRE